MPERLLGSILDAFRKKSPPSESPEPPKPAGAEIKEPSAVFTEEEDRRLKGYLLAAKARERAGDKKGELELYERYLAESTKIKAGGKEAKTEIPAEHLEILREFFKGETLDQITMPGPEELTAEYFDKMYPETQREEDTARGLVSYRPGWWKDTADTDVVGPDKETWGEAYVRSMKAEADNFNNKPFFTESLFKPPYTDGSQQYGTKEGADASLDPLLPLIKEVFGEDKNRFNLTHDELTANLLPKVKEKLQQEFAKKHLPVPNFEVILTPAIISNLQTTLNHPENSQTDTSEWTSTILLKQDGTDSGHRLYSGGGGYGGAGYVGNDRRGNRRGGRGFRLSVVFEK